MNKSELDGKYQTSYQKISDYISKVEYLYQNETVSLSMIHVYDSIYLWANDVHMKRIPCELIDNYHFLKINVCLEGNCEVKVSDGRYVYLDSNMVNIDTNQSSGYYQYPAKRYRGIEITFDIEKLKKQEVSILVDLDLSIEKLISITEREGGSFIAKANTAFIEMAEHIYQKLIKADGSIYEYRYDLIQLLYKLNNGCLIQNEKSFYLTKGQREIAQAAEEILTKDLSIRYSIENLSEQFKISPSSLKKYFDICFGVKVSEYMHKKRMEEGKRRLAQTKESVIEIASKVGYTNQGKFCSAFKKETGVTPLEFRRLKVGYKA